MTILELETRLDTLGQSLPPRDPAFAPRVLSNLPPQESPRPASIHLFIKAGLALAASLALVVALWSLLMTTPQPAYAIAELPQRLLQLDSLHMVGQTFPTDGSPPQPLEYFVRRPTEYRINGLIAMENFKLSDVSDWINTADSMTVINHMTRTAHTRSQTAAQAQGRTKYEMNMLVASLFGPWTEYRKLRDEMLGGTKTEVYQASVNNGSKTLLWYSPQTGLPVRLETYTVEQGQPDKLWQRFTKIENNTPIADAVFQAEIPAGFEVTHRNPSTDVDAYGRLTLNNHRLCIRYAAMTPAGDYLLCWALFDKKSPKTDLKLLNAPSPVTITFTTASGKPLREHRIREDASPEGYHWRWSLLRPAVAEHAPSVGFDLNETDKSGSGGGVEVALPMDTKEFEEVQRQTLPKDQQPMTLQQIEQAAK